LRTGAIAESGRRSAQPPVASDRIIYGCDNEEEHMEQIVPFADDRLLAGCVYCGGVESLTRDHVPSKVLLDEPFPDNLPVVPACDACNQSFSSDELYFACVLESVVSGGELSRMRPRIARRLKDMPDLRARVEASRVRSADGRLIHQVEVQRVRSVLLKLARGHVAYELSEPHAEDPAHVRFSPIEDWTDSEMKAFITPPTSQAAQVWPEIGSRAFILRAAGNPAVASASWFVVQHGRYQYMAEVGRAGTLVRMLIRDYLAAEVIWE